MNKTKYPKRLYKFKSAKDYNVEALINNKIYLPNFEELNDPLEFDFYINNGRKDKIDNFKKSYTKDLLCLSFSNKMSRRLWDYYTDGMKGMVIKYKPSAINTALDKNSLNTIYIDSKNKKSNGKVAYKGFVKYISSKINLTNEYNEFLQNPKIDISSKYLNMFFKDNSWDDENEFRFIINKKDILIDKDTKKYFLKDLIPDSIYVGYRMSKENKNKIKKYCEKSKIPMFEYNPNFESKSRKSFISTTLYDPTNELPKNLEISMKK